MSNQQEEKRKRSDENNTKDGRKARPSSQASKNLKEKSTIIENDPTPRTNRYGSASNSRPTNLITKPESSVNKTSLVKDPTLTPGTLPKGPKFYAKQRKLSYSPIVIFNCNVDDFGDLVFKILEETEYLIKFLAPFMISIPNQESKIEIAIEVLQVNRHILETLINTPSHGVDMHNLFRSAHVLLLNLFKCLDVKTSREIVPLQSTLNHISVYIHSYFNHVTVLISLLTTAKQVNPSQGIISFFPLKKSADYASRSYYGVNRYRKYRHMPSTSGYQMERSKKLYATHLKYKQTKYRTAPRKPEEEDFTSEDSTDL